MQLFWDVDPRAVDLDLHRDYVLERVMLRGGWEAMKWLRQAYSSEELQAFLLKHGRHIPPREYAYWALIAGLPRNARTGGGRPGWAGP